MRGYNTLVTSTATLLIAADNINRTCYIHVVGNQAVALGGATVTYGTGLLTEKHTTPVPIFVPLGEAIYAVTPNGTTENVRVLVPDQD